MSVRFLHTADLHLGSPLQTVCSDAPTLQDQLRNASYTAFERVIDLAIDETVDFVLIAGDLYDQESRSVKANEFLVTQFQRLADQSIPVYVVYGNHDPLGQATQFVEFPDNIYEFGCEEAEEHLYPDSEHPEARIWGQSYRDRRESRKMYRGFTPVDNRIPNIGVLHSGLDPDSNSYVPCAKGDLQGKESIHYWALGHIHQTRVDTDSQPIVYPGIPQGRQITEPGVGGCLLVELNTTGSPDLEFVPTSPIVWQDIVLSTDDAEESLSTLDDIQRYIETVAADLSPILDDLADELSIPVRKAEWNPAGHVCRWRLTGRGDPHSLFEEDEAVFERLEERLRDALSFRDPFIWTESIQDRTSPGLPDVDTLRGDDDVIDAFDDLRTTVQDDAALRQDLRDEAGWIWDDVDDHEDGDENRLALTDDKFEELLDRAEQTVLDELLTRRV